MNADGRRPPRILHILPHDGVGGVEVAARSMVERGDLPCDFRLVLIAGATLTNRRERVFESPFRRPSNPLAQVRALWISLRAQPDIVLASLWRSVPLLVLLRILRPRLRLVYFLNAEQPYHLVDSLFSRVAIACVDELWADSTRTLDARLAGRQAIGRVISFVTERLAPAAPFSAPPSPTFVCWCRLSPRKGLDRVIRFIASLRGAGIDAQLDLWGPDDGELLNLTELVRQLGLNRHISFHGLAARDELHKMATGCSFFILLTRSEGMAMSAVEAMQLGLVPVVTAVGEMANYVVNGETGIIFDPDDPDTAARAVASLLTNAEEFEQMRRRIVAVWAATSLYPDDVCRAAMEVIAQAKENSV